MTARKKREISFEEGMKKLELLVEQLKQSDIPLEEAVKLYEEGKALTVQLEEKLAQQKRRIEIIDPDTAEIETFEENEHDVQ